MIYADKKEFIVKNIRNTDIVLDVGFWGQGKTIYDPNWVHALLKNSAQEVYGIDIEFDTDKIVDTTHYQKASAESFDFSRKFDVVFAGDLIEHLSNQGSFLSSVERNIREDGRLILTTPNCFNLFNLAEKLTKYEPTVNSDHTCYFNVKTLKQLLNKNGWEVVDVSYVYSLGLNYKQSIRKMVLNILYFIVSRFTDKFVETLVVTTKKGRVVGGEEPRKK